MRKDEFRELLRAYTAGAIKALDDNDYRTAEIILGWLEELIESYKKKEVLK